MKTPRIPICHSDRPYYSKGKCKNCAQADWAKAHPEIGRNRTKRYRERHPEKVREGNQQQYYKDVKASRERQREYRRDNSEQTRLSQRRQHLKENYGLTPEAWEELFQSQGGKCANPRCNNKEDLHVDHLHVDGWKDMPPEERRKYVRGLLCGACNRSLGHASENDERLLGLVEYRQRFSGTEIQSTVHAQRQAVVQSS